MDSRRLCLPVGQRRLPPGTDVGWWTDCGWMADRRRTDGRMVEGSMDGRTMNSACAACKRWMHGDD